MIIEWTEPAELDLSDIYEFIARDVPLYAEQFVDKILSIVEHLSDNPQLGRKVPEAKQDNIRELIFQNYRIIYALKNEHIYIIALIHASRDLSNTKNQSWEIL